MLYCIMSNLQNDGQMQLILNALNEMTVKWRLNLDDLDNLDDG